MIAWSPMKKVRAQAFASVPRIRMVVVSQGSILRPATDQLIQRGEVYLESYFNGHLIKRFIAPEEVAQWGLAVWSNALSATRELDLVVATRAGKGIHSKVAAAFRPRQSWAAITIYENHKRGSVSVRRGVAEFPLGEAHDRRWVDRLG